MMLRRPTRNLWLFLSLVVAVGALFGHVLEGAAFAVFFFFISSIDHKPAFKALFDPPGNPDSGRSGGCRNTSTGVPSRSPTAFRLGTWPGSAFGLRCAP